MSNALIFQYTTDISRGRRNRILKVRFQIALFPKFLIIRALHPEGDTSCALWSAIPSIKNGQIEWLNAYYQELDEKYYPNDLREFCQKLVNLRVFL